MMKGSQNKLHGLRVLNTRPLAQGRPLSEAIDNAGGISIDFPAIAIEPTNQDWLNALPNLAGVHHVIFISTNAVNYFYKALQQNPLQWPNTIQITTIGLASASALEQWGRLAGNTPLIADSEHLLELDVLQDVKHQTILLIKGEGGRMEIINTLKKRGAHVVSIDVYRRVLPHTAPENLHTVLHEGRVDIILFTSEQAIQNLFLLMGAAARSWLCRTPCLVISHRLAEVATLFGMQTIIVSSHDKILDALENYKKG